MTKDQAEDILKEYALFMSMQRILLTNYKLDSTSRVPRGSVQREIAEALNHPLNHKFYSLFNSVTLKLKLRKILVNGSKYYKGLASRENNY